MTKRYSNGEITVISQPALCHHSGVCARGLPQVFSPMRRPWIELSHGTTAEIASLVDRCPSGALTWKRVADDTEA